jgi:hypothetical protein
MQTGTPDNDASRDLRRISLALGDHEVTSLPGELRELGDALRAAAGACDAAGARMLPATCTGESSGDRYRRAAEGWPVSPAPSHERLAALLFALHGTSTALRLAAECTERAHRAVDVALVQGVPAEAEP